MERDTTKDSKLYPAEMLDPLYLKHGVQRNSAYTTPVQMFAGNAEVGDTESYGAAARLTGKTVAAQTASDSAKCHVLGKKDDSSKAPLQQGAIDYFPRALKAVANISRFGKEKYKVEYSDQNWRRVEGAEGRYKDARARHIADEAIDGLYAEDSELLHAAHAAWNSLAYLDLLLTRGVPERKP